MNKEQVFILITADHWIAKNNLHKTILEGMKKINQTLTHFTVAEKLIKHVFDKAHEENPRCKALRWHKSEERDESRTIYFLTCIHVSVIKVKHEML